MDDLLNTGSFIFEKHSEKTFKTFNSESAVYNNFDSYECQVSTFKEALFVINQYYYELNIIHIDQHATFRPFRRNLALLFFLCLLSQKFLVTQIKHHRC